MSLLSQLILTYLVLRSQASSLGRRLSFGLAKGERVFSTEDLSNSFIFRQNDRYRNSRSLFLDSDPAPANTASPSQIFFPGDILPGGVVSYPTWSGDVENRNSGSLSSTGVASSCGVGADLKYTYEGSTWRLLSRGRCAEGEWVVMMAECQPGCRPRPCPPGQVEHRGQCVNMTDTTMCARGQVLYIDQTGSTFCDCENDHFYYPWDGQCYTRQEQGPCDFGYYLDVSENGKVDCVSNYCQVDWYVKDPASGRCFRKDYVGYCPKNSLQFHNNNQTVECFIFGIRVAFGYVTPSCIALSRPDAEGKCQYVVPTSIVLPRSRTTGCPNSFVSVGDGPCRRVNNLIY